MHMLQVLVACNHYLANWDDLSKYSPTNLKLKKWWFNHPLKEPGVFSTAAHEIFSKTAMDCGQVAIFTPQILHSLYLKKAQRGCNGLVDHHGSNYDSNGIEELLPGQRISLHWWVAPPPACHGHVAHYGSVGRHKNVIKRQHVVTVCLHDMFVINYMPLKSFSTKCVFVEERRIQHWFKLIAC